MLAKKLAKSNKVIIKFSIINLSCRTNDYYGYFFDSFEW